MAKTYVVDGAKIGMAAYIAHLEKKVGSTPPPVVPPVVRTEKTALVFVNSYESYVTAFFAMKSIAAANIGHKYVVRGRSVMEQVKIPVSVQLALAL